MTELKWEYHTLLHQPAWFTTNMDASPLDEKLNQLGRDGWELVSAVSSSVGQGLTKDLALIFKRAIREERSS